MLTSKSSAHIPTSRLIKGFRSGRSSTGRSMRHVEAGRKYQERMGLANRRRRRVWLERQWGKHVRRQAIQAEEQNS